MYRGSEEPDDERPASLVIGRPSSACGLLTSSLYTPYPPEAPLRGSDGVTRRRSETRNDGPRKLRQVVRILGLEVRLNGHEI